MVSFGLSAAGPGAISVQSVTVLFAVALAVQMKVSPILMGVMAILGAVGGTASPIALTGIIVGDMMTEMGIEGSINNIFIGVSVSNFVCAAVMYILLGGYKLRGNAESGEKRWRNLHGISGSACLPYSSWLCWLSASPMM